MPQNSGDGTTELVILHDSSCQKHQNPPVQRSYQKLFVDSSWLNEQLLGSAVAGSLDWGLLVNSNSDKVWMSSCLPHSMFQIFGMFCFAVRVYLQMRTLRSDVPSRQRARMSMNPLVQTRWDASPMFWGKDESPPPNESTQAAEWISAWWLWWDSHS